MTGDQDVTVKIVSMAQGVDKAIEHRRGDTSLAAGRTLAEVMMCTVLLGTTLTENETLQVNIVGSGGLQHAIAICDHNLNSRCKISNYTYNPPVDDSVSDAVALFGDGAQIQVVRTHPSYNNKPSTGIIQVQSGHIPFNMGVYMQGSEQRTAAFVTRVRPVFIRSCLILNSLVILCTIRHSFAIFLVNQVNFENGYCKDAIGILVEALPRENRNDENIERCIRNLERAILLGIDNISRMPDDHRVDACDFDIFPTNSDMLTSREGHPGVHALMDVCLSGSGKSMRWERPVEYKCSCGSERVWNMLRLLDRKELRETLKEHPVTVPVSIRLCDLLTLYLFR